MSRISAFVLLLLVSAFGTMGQSLRKGLLVDAEDNQPIAYAVLQRQSDGRAVMTNADGVFQVELQPNDSLRLRHVGYLENVFGQPTSGEWILRAQVKNEELPAVELRAENAAVELFWEMVKNGRKLATNVRDKKSFYRLMTQQLSGDPYEYLEAFYQTETTANGLEYIGIKSGRYAFVDREEAFFSADLSRLLTQMRFFRTFGEVDNLPVFPSALPRKRIESEYDLSVERMFYQESGTIAEVRLTSKDGDEEYFYWIDTEKAWPVRIQMTDRLLKERPFEAIDPDDQVIDIGMGCTVDFAFSKKGFFVEQYRLKFGYTYLRPGQPNLYLETDMNWVGYEDGRFIEPINYALSQYHTDYHYYNRIPMIEALWEHEYAVLASEEQKKTIELFKDLDFRGNFFGDSINGKKVYFKDSELPMVWQRISSDKDQEQLGSFNYINEQDNSLVFDLSVNGYCWDDQVEWKVEPEFVGDSSYFREARTPAALRYVRLAWRITELKAAQWESELQKSGICLEQDKLESAYLKKINELSEELFQLSSQTNDGKYESKLLEWEQRYPLED